MVKLQELSAYLLTDHNFIHSLLQTYWLKDGDCSCFRLTGCHSILNSCQSSLQTMLTIAWRAQAGSKTVWLTELDWDTVPQFRTGNIKRLSLKHDCVPTKVSLSAERRRRRPTSATSWQLSAKYGMLSCSATCTSTELSRANVYQQEAIVAHAESTVMWSHCRAPETTYAATFGTDCKCYSRLSVMLYSMELQ